MLANIQPLSSLGSLARAKARDYATKTVSESQVDKLTQQGWTEDRKNKKSIRLRRTKAHGTLLEDRVWALLFRMEFDYLSGDNGAKVLQGGEEGPSTQLDVVALDKEVA